MTDQERQLIEALADRIRNAPAPQVDRDADELIRRTIGSRPDALYILTQTVLLQEMALNQAKAQIEQLKHAPQTGSGFLPESSQPPQGGRSWGGEGRAPQPPANPGGFQASSYRTGNNPPPPPPPVQEPMPQQGGGGFSNFLHNAATTAAGVIAGETAFSALSSIFGHHSGGYFGGGPGFFGGGAGISPASETIINNYYDDDRGRGGERDRALDPGLSPDLEDRRFADTGSDRDDSVDDTDSDDDNSDDSNGDDSSYDDGSGSGDL